MTHTGRDNWADMNYEQRARLVRDMPLVEDEPERSGAWPFIILALIVFWTLAGGIVIHFVSR